MPRTLAAAVTEGGGPSKAMETLGGRTPVAADDGEAPAAMTGVWPPCDRWRRNEWSEGAVTSLLDAYEYKWGLRSGAKLKGRDWDDIARRVSNRAGGSRPQKTPAQCKNKMETMKKRYRSESTCGRAPSRWPHFSRLDVLIHCPPAAAAGCPTPHSHPPPAGAAVEEGDAAGDAAEDDPAEKTRECDAAREMLKMSRKGKRRRDAEEGRLEVAVSIRLLAEAVMKVEQLRADVMAEVERMRAEMEAEKMEVELRKAEIVARTQLRIAKLLVRSGSYACKQR